MADAIYDAASFTKKDISNKMLGRWCDLLTRLRELDHRGAYFAKEDMLAALKIVVDAQGTRVQCRVFAEKKGITPDEYVALVSLKTRVMCSHERSRRAPASSSPGEASARKKARVHPFSAFRDDEDEDDEDNEPSDAEVEKVAGHTRWKRQRLTFLMAARCQRTATGPENVAWLSQSGGITEVLDWSSRTPGSSMVSWCSSPRPKPKQQDRPR